MRTHRDPSVSGSGARPSTLVSAPDASLRSGLTSGLTSGLGTGLTAVLASGLASARAPRRPPCGPRGLGGVLGGVLAVVCGWVLGGCGSSSTTAAPDAGSAPGSAPEVKATATAMAPTSASPSAPAASSAAPGTSASAAPDGAAAFVADPSITATTTTMETAAGPVVVHAVHHGTLYFELGGKVLWLDPWGEALAKLPGGGASAPRADFVLLTDIHQDHLDEKALAQVKKDGAVVMGPKAVAEKVPGTTVIANGETKTLGATDEGPIEVVATPMYNLKRGPEAGKLFHDRGRGNGYVLTFGGKRIYISGDTECTPEMKALKDIDLALVVMNLPYTMPPDEAAECITAFAPKVVVPYHHRGSDLGVLDTRLAGTGVKVEKLKLY